MVNIPFDELTQQDWAHALLKLPTSQLLDITGPSSPETVLHTYAKYDPSLEEVSRPTLTTLLKGDIPSYPLHEQLLIEDFAKLLLAQNSIAS